MELPRKNRKILTLADMPRIRIYEWVEKKDRIKE